MKILNWMIKIVNVRIYFRLQYESYYKYKTLIFINIQVICDTNFKISGSPQLMCMSNGEFDKQIPKCSQVVYKCVTPNIANGAIAGPDVSKTFLIFKLRNKDCLKFESCFPESGTRNYNTVYNLY